MQDRHSVLVLTCRYYCLPSLLILHCVQSDHVLLLHTHCFSIRCTMLLTMFWGPLVLLRKLRELKTILQGKSNWQPTTHEMKHKNDFQWVTLEAGRLRIPGSCCDIICRLFSPSFFGFVEQRELLYILWAYTLEVILKWVYLFSWTVNLICKLYNFNCMSIVQHLLNERFISKLYIEI